MDSDSIIFSKFEEILKKFPNAKLVTEKKVIQIIVKHFRLSKFDLEYFPMKATYRQTN